MKHYRLEATPAVELDIEAASSGTNAKMRVWVLSFLKQLRAPYERIQDHPIGYQELRSGIRRALTRQFPYAIYFSIEDELTIVILAVIHTARDPAEWQRRI